jgi:CcmD family protein
MFKKILIATFFIFNSLLVVAQSNESSIEMATVMRSNGKIYIVVAVVAVIFTGIIVYLINLDSKITAIEKKLGKK